MYYRENRWAPYAEATFVPNPQYAGSDSAGFRGVEQPEQVADSQMVFIDSGGRAVMCQSGRIVFMDGTVLSQRSSHAGQRQGFLIEQGQAGAGVVGEAQVNQECSVLQEGQARVQAGLNGQTPADAKRLPRVKLKARLSRVTHRPPRLRRRLLKTSLEKDRPAAPSMSIKVNGK